MPCPERHLTITGVVQSPLYISIERGTSSLGDGNVDAYVLLPEASFQLDYYTVCNVVASGAKELDAYSDAYEDLIDGLKEQLTATAEVRAAQRYDDLTSEAQQQIDEGQQELDEARQKLTDGAQALADSRKELTMAGRH